MFATQLEVMYRYVEDYTNNHDLNVAREIMHPDYQFTMSGKTLNREAYLEMVDDALSRFTDLRLIVDEFVVGEKRLAMAFRETATSPRHGRSGVWRGVALYDFHSDGRLLAANVEQDFWGRRAQFYGLTPSLKVGITDPVVWETCAGIENEENRIALEKSLSQLDTKLVMFDEGEELVVSPEFIEVMEVILAGSRFAARIRINGEYSSKNNSLGLSVLPANPVEMVATGVGTLNASGGLDSARFITDRFGLWSQYREIET